MLTRKKGGENLQWDGKKLKERGEKMKITKGHVFNAASIMDILGPLKCSE